MLCSTLNILFLSKLRDPSPLSISRKRRSILKSNKLQTPLKPYCFDLATSNSTLLSHPPIHFYLLEGERVTAVELETLETIDFAMEMTTPFHLAALSPCGLARRILS